MTAYIVFSPDVDSVCLSKEAAKARMNELVQCELIKEPGTVVNEFGDAYVLNHKYYNQIISYGEYAIH